MMTGIGGGLIRGYFKRIDAVYPVYNCDGGFWGALVCVLLIHIHLYLALAAGTAVVIVIRVLATYCWDLPWPPHEKMHTRKQKICPKIVMPTTISEQNRHFATMKRNFCDRIGKTELERKNAACAAKGGQMENVRRMRVEKEDRLRG